MTYDPRPLYACQFEGCREQQTFLAEDLAIAPNGLPICEECWNHWDDQTDGAPAPRDADGVPTQMFCDLPEYAPPDMVLVFEMLEQLKACAQFIENGVENGYIRLSPNPDDPENSRLEAVRAVIAKAKGEAS